MLILTNDKKLMGEYVNKKGYNIIAWSTIVILVALTMIYLGLLLGIL